MLLGAWFDDGRVRERSWGVVAIDTLSLYIDRKKAGNHPSQPSLITASPAPQQDVWKMMDVSSRGPSDGHAGQFVAPR